MNNRKMKILIIAALSCVTAGVEAKELPSGTFEVGGDMDIGYSSSTMTINGTDTDNDTTKFDVNALYYVRPNIGLGLVWGYEKDHSTSGASSETQTTNIIGGAASYNISITEQMSLRPRVEFVTASIKDETIDLSGTGWTIGANLSYFPSDYVSFDTHVAYLSLSFRDSGLDIDADDSGISFGVGLSVYLR